MQSTIWLSSWSSSTKSGETSTQFPQKVYFHAGWWDILVQTESWSDKLTAVPVHTGTYFSTSLRIHIYTYTKDFITWLIIVYKSLKFAICKQHETFNHAPLLLVRTSTFSGHIAHIVSIVVVVVGVLVVCRQPTATTTTWIDDFKIPVNKLLTAPYPLFAAKATTYGSAITIIITHTAPFGRYAAIPFYLFRTLPGRP